MGYLDACDALPSTPESTVSDRKSESRRRTRAASHGRAGRILYDPFAASVVGLFRSRFRAGLFVVFVLSGFRFARSGCVGTATNRRLELLARVLRRGVGA